MNDLNDLTPEEEVEAYIYPIKLTPEEKAQASADFKIFREKALAKMSEKDFIAADLMRIWSLMRQYAESKTYDKSHDFSVYLAEYIHILKKKQVNFAAEIGLHPTKLNQILNGKAMPNAALTYRLEKHSGGIIEAKLWWQLIAKRIEHDIVNNHDTKLKEQKKVLFTFGN
jgi:plasmid maintenance system antidote protein VapI